MRRPIGSSAAERGAHQRFVHDGDERRVPGVGGGEVAAARDRDPQRPEVVGSRHVQNGLRRSRARREQGRRPLDGEGAVRTPGRRHAGHAAGRVDSGQRADVGEQVAVERRGARRLVEGPDRKLRVQDDQPIRLEAHVDGGQRGQAPGQQAGARDEHHRHGNLGDDKGVAHPGAAGADRGALAAFTQPGAQLHP